LFAALRRRKRREAPGSWRLAVYGVWQCEGDVGNLVAQRLVDVSPMLGELQAASRNFH
jgi:error-prone DNA polymerase